MLRLGCVSVYRALMYGSCKCMRGSFTGTSNTYISGMHLCCSVLQCVAVCCSVLQCVAVCFSVFTRAIHTSPKLREGSFECIHGSCECMWGSLKVCEVLWSVCKALLSICRALLSICRALLSVCRALFFSLTTSLKCTEGSFECTLTPTPIFTHPHQHQHPLRESC